MPTFASHRRHFRPCVLPQSGGKRGSVQKAHGIYPKSMGYNVLNLETGHFQMSYKAACLKHEFYQRTGGSLFNLVRKRLVPIYAMTVFLNCLTQKALFSMCLQCKNLHSRVWNSSEQEWQTCQPTHSEVEDKASQRSVFKMQIKKKPFPHCWCACFWFSSLMWFMPQRGKTFMPQCCQCTIRSKRGWSMHFSNSETCCTSVGTGDFGSFLKLVPHWI